MINIIVEQLRQGKDLNWPVLWKTIGKVVSHKEYFDDYVPPYKNLGAVFIMAYKKEQMNTEDWSVNKNIIEKGLISKNDFAFDYDIKATIAQIFLSASYQDQ